MPTILPTKFSTHLLAILRSMTTHYARGFLFLPIVNNKIINKINSSCKTPDFFEMKEYNISETKVNTVVAVYLQ